MKWLWKISSDSFLSAILYRYSASLILYFTSFAVGMFVSKRLGPELLGYWGLFQIIAHYFAFSNLGATNGLTRELGICLGKNEKSSINNIIGAANAIQIVLPGIASLALVIYSFFLAYPVNWVFLFSGIYGFFHLYEEFLIRIINSFERHKLLARITIIRSIISFSIILPLVYLFDLQGRILSSLLVAIIGLLITYKHLPVPLKINFNRKHIVSLISVGFPIALSGFLALNFFLVDRLVITKFLTIKDLGLYTFAFYLVTVVKNIKSNVSNILYQRQNIIFGEKGDENRMSLFEISKSSTLFTTDLTGILSGLLLIVFSFFVRFFMPEYNNSLSITYIIVFSQVIGNINVFNTVGKHKQYLVIMAISLAINIALSILFMRLWNLTGVAYATLLSFVIFNIVINYANLKYFGLSKLKILKFIIRIISVPLYCYATSKGLEFLLYRYQSTHIGKDIILMIMFLIAYVIIMIPLFLMLKKHINHLNQIKVGDT